MSSEQDVKKTIDTFSSDVRRELEGRFERLLNDVARQNTENEQRWRSDIEKAGHDARIAAERAFAARLAGVRVEHGREIESRLATERVQHAREMESRITGERAELERRLASQVAAARAAAREEYAREFDARLADTKRLHAVELAQTLDSHIADTRATFDVQLRERDSRLAEARAAHEAHVLELESRMASARAAHVRELDAQLADARSSHAGRLRDLETELTRAREAHALEMEQSAAEREALKAAIEAAKAEMREEQVDAFTRLLTTVRRLDDANTLSGILDTLARGASLEASRVAVLVVEGDTLRSWSHFGFTAGQGPTDLPIGSAGVLTAALALKQPSFVSPAVDAHEPTTPPFMRMQSGHAGLIVPILVGGDVVALLYADGVERQTDQENAATWVEQLEMLARHAALRLENLTSQRAVESLSRS